MWGEEEEEGQPARSRGGVERDAVKAPADLVRLPFLLAVSPYLSPPQMGAKGMKLCAAVVDMITTQMLSLHFSIF